MAELVTKRYATALFSTALEKNAVDELWQEASEICKIFLDNPDYMVLLGHPKILIEEKIDALTKAFDGKIADELMGLLVLMVKKSRENYIIDVLNEFIKMAKEKAGYIEAVVTSAINLEENQLMQIKENIQTSTNKKVELVTVVDETIIGGLIIRVGDKVVDNSIKGKMNVLKGQLSNLRLV